MLTSFEDATKYLNQAIDAAGFIPRPAAREAIRSDIEANYGGEYLAAVLADSVKRHAHMLTKKAAEPVPPQPTGPSEAELERQHAEITAMEIVRAVQAEFPCVDLVYSTKNRDKVVEFLDATCGGRVTLASFRTAVRALLPHLEEYPAPAPEPEPELPEVLKTLADGSKQLSINCSEADLRNPAVTPLQLRDYLRRSDPRTNDRFN